MELGELIDSLYKQRASRLALEKQVEEMKQDEAATRELIQEQLKSVGLNSGRGSLATASIITKEGVTVTDWDALHAFIKKEDMMGLLHRRITIGLWKELRDSGVEVPGTESLILTDISLTKSKA